MVIVLTDRNKNKSKAQKKADEAVKAFVSSDSFKRDPLGSYTGHSINKSEQPDQDGDDL